MLTLHQLEVFAAVATEMSVSRAADRLHVSQPAVSSSLAALQRELGVELVVRSGRGIELTDAGRAMYKYASLVLGLVEEGVDAVHAAADHRDRPFRVGATSSIVSHVIAPILSTLRLRQPDLRFSLEIGNRSQVWRQLAAHETDLAVSTRPPSTQPFVSLATRPNSFLLVARPGTVLAGRLGEVTWLVRESGATTRAASDEIIARLGLEPATLEIGSDDAIRGSIEAGLGVGVLPADVVAESLRTRVLLAFPTPATPLEQPWHLIVRRGEDLEPALRRFVADVVHADASFTWTAEGLELVATPGSTDVG